jgi:hypothetical protein
VPETPKKKSRRRSRRRRKTSGEKTVEKSPSATQISAAEHGPEPPLHETIRIKPSPGSKEPDAVKTNAAPSPEAPGGKAASANQDRGNGGIEDPLNRLKKVFETLED